MWNFLFDFLLIRYPIGSYINWHVDPVPPPKKHYRINWVFKKSKEGGEFGLMLPGRWEYYSNNRINFFRPDIQQHKVTEVKGSERWVLSLGWCVNEKVHSNV